MYHYLEKSLEYEEKDRICGPNRNSYFKTDKDATAMCLKEDYYLGNWKAPADLQVESFKKPSQNDYQIKLIKSKRKTSMKKQNQIINVNKKL